MSSTLTVDVFLSVDGWAGSDGLPGYFGYMGPELVEWNEAEGVAPQLVIMGRRTYRHPTNRRHPTPILWDQGMPGDIVGFPGHVAIYLGTIDGTCYILEASWVGTPIHVVPLTRTDYDNQLHRYWTAANSA